MRDYTLLKSNYWTDGQTEDRSADANYLLLYLLTCNETNNIGVCETTERRIELSTALDKDRIEAAIAELNEKGDLFRLEQDNRFFVPCFIDREIQHNKGSNEINAKMLINLRQLYNTEQSETIKDALVKRYPAIFTTQQTQTMKTEQQREPKKQTELTGNSFVDELIESGTISEDAGRKNMAEYNERNVYKHLQNCGEIPS